MHNPDKIPDFLQPFRGRRLLAGFSGGSDSTALLLLLCRWGWRGELLEAVHFEHGLRGEASRRDAAWCEAFCRARGIAFRRIDLRLECGPSLEARARAARLDYWQSRAPACVALGHHAGDADETLLFRLGRGGNASGLTGLRPLRRLGGVTLLRPLLDWRKAELIDFLAQQGVADWRTDASNASDDFDRNYLRNQLLPQWFAARPRVRAGLARARQALALDADFIEQCARRRLARLPSSAVTPVRFWRQCHPALLPRILRGYLERQTGQSIVFGHAAPTRFRAELLRDHPQNCEFELGHGIRFRLRRGLLELLGPEDAASLPDASWDWRRQPTLEYGGWQFTARLLKRMPSGGASDTCFWFDGDRLPSPLTLGFRRRGERMTVLGESRPRRLKHLIANAKMFRPPVVLRSADGEALAVTGVRRGAAFPVAPESATVVCIECKNDRPDI